MRLLVLVTAGLLLSGAPPVHAGELTSEMDGVRVELTSSPSRPGLSMWPASWTAPGNLSPAHW